MIRGMDRCSIKGRQRRPLIEHFLTLSRIRRIRAVLIKFYLKRILITLILVFSQYCTFFQDISIPENYPEENASDYAKAEKELKAIHFLKTKTANTNYSISKLFILNRPISERDDIITSVINFFHWTTEKSVIKSEVLINENTNTSFDDIEESERLLRSLPSIKDAKIYLNKVGDDKFDAYIYTQDKLSSTLSWNVAGSGGYNYLLLAAGDTNLFGRLIEVTGQVENENFVTTPGITLGQSRVFGSSWNISSLFRESFVEGKQNYSSQKISLLKPFRTLGERYALSAFFQHEQGTRYRFASNGIEAGFDSVSNKVFPLVYDRNLLKWSLSLTRAYGRLDRIEIGGGLAQRVDRYKLIQLKDQFTINVNERSDLSKNAIAKNLPLQENASIINFRLNLKSIEYLTRKNFSLFTFTEDLTRGVIWLNKLEIARPIASFTDSFYKVESTASYVYDEKKHRYRFFVKRRLRIQNHAPVGFVNDLTEIDQRYYYFFYYGVFAVRQNVKLGNHLSKDNEFIQGGNYIRGLAFKSKTGSLAYLTSFEYRTPPLQVLYFALGGIAFFDLGEVNNYRVTEIKKFQPQPVVGLGFRFSLVEYDKSIFRFDFGFPLNAKEFDLLAQMSFGLSQSF